ADGRKKTSVCGSWKRANNPAANPISTCVREECRLGFREARRTIALGCAAPALFRAAGDDRDTGDLLETREGRPRSVRRRLRGRRRRVTSSSWPLLERAHSRKNRTVATSRNRLLVLIDGVWRT